MGKTRGRISTKSRKSIAGVILLTCKRSVTKVQQNKFNTSYPKRGISWLVKYTEILNNSSCCRLLLSAA